MCLKCRGRIMNDLSVVFLSSVTWASGGWIQCPPASFSLRPPLWTFWFLVIPFFFSSGHDTSPCFCAFTHTCTHLHAGTFSLCGIISFYKTLGTQSNVQTYLRAFNTTSSLPPLPGQHQNEFTTGGEWGQVDRIVNPSGQDLARQQNARETGQSEQGPSAWYGVDCVKIRATYF